MSVWNQITERIRRRRKFLLQIVTPLVVLVLTMLWLLGVFRRDRISGHEPVAAATVRARPAGTETLVIALTPRTVVSEMVGEVKPEFAINVASKVTAHIAQLDIRAGARVRQGEVLALLDDRDYQARVRQAEEALARATATRDYARTNRDRDRGLLAKGDITGDQFDQSETRFQEAEAEVARLQQALEEARVNLSYTKILSPVDGIVIDRLANAGDLAVPGKPLLTMFDPRHLWLQASVREEDADRLKLGQAYRVRVDALDLELTGPLVEIVPAADAVGRTVWARVRLTADERLYPGMFGRLLLPTGQTEELLIPRRALRQVGQLDMVDVETPWGVEQRVVILGRAAGDQVEILSGLKPGEKLLVPVAPAATQP
jgi:membrane fusion protein (multidrug efflux system)